jgi:uncharacterized repeat protein (TIGR01451 family)
MKNNSFDLGRFGRSLRTKLIVGAATALLVASVSATWCLFAVSPVPNVNPSKNNMAPDSPAVTPFVDIASAGPLTHVYLGNELSCQVAHTGDSSLEFYPPGAIPGDSGTFIAMAGTLYAPDFLAHGTTATGNIGTRVVFTPISQTGVTGTGTTADPFKVVTVAGVGTTGLRIQQTDSYVVGDEFYRTETILINNGSSSASGVLYRAADAFLSGSDRGFGFTETFGGNRDAVGCSVNANNTPPGRIEEWIPLTGGNNFYQNEFSTVWSFIGTKAPFPDTCTCSTFQDNGAGISWNFNIPAGGSATYSHFTTFSPLGRQPLVASKTADNATSAPGSQNGYTITIENPNPDSITLSSITDTLPAGFSYVSGSTTGVTTDNPIVNGQMLTWSGLPFLVAGHSSISLHFAVTVASTAGNYFNEAGGTAAGADTVAGTGPTAQITVGSTTPTPTPTPGGTVTVGIEAIPHNVAEGTNATFNFLAFQPPAQTITVHYSVSGKARLNVDYTLSGTPGQVQIPAGQHSAPLTLHAITDTVREKKENVVVTITPGTGYVFPTSGRHHTPKAPKETIFILP